LQAIAEIVAGEKSVQNQLLERSVFHAEVAAELLPPGQ
jgi:hypothetical protein